MKRYRWDVFVLLAFLLILVGFALTAPFAPSSQRATAYLGGREFQLEVAATPFLRARGLSGQSDIPAEGGMIFLFEKPARYTFWMKNMKIPIDIIWLRGERIVGVVSRAEPPLPGTPEVAIARFTAPEPIDRVIEIRAGLAGALSLYPGQEVKILIP
jgi:hypothetical protein